MQNLDGILIVSSYCQLAMPKSWCYKLQNKAFFMVVLLFFPRLLCCFFPDYFVVFPQLRMFFTILNWGRMKPAPTTCLSNSSSWNPMYSKEGRTVRPNTTPQEESRCLDHSLLLMNVSSKKFKLNFLPSEASA